MFDPELIQIKALNKEWNSKSVKRPTPYTWDEELATIVNTKTKIEDEQYVWRNQNRGPRLGTDSYKRSKTSVSCQPFPWDISYRNFRRCLLQPKKKKKIEFCIFEHLEILNTCGKKQDSSLFFFCFIRDNISFLQNNRIEK